MFHLIIKINRARMDDRYHVHNFYTNHRNPLKPTTLHDGNLPQDTYDDVMYVRRMTCKEPMPGRSDYKFNTRGYNKENVAPKTKWH